MFSPSVERRLRRRWIGRKNRRLTDLWNLLQCKSLAATVPKEMILKAYEDHGKLLSTVGVTPEPILASVRAAAREWAEVVREKYEEKISLAPSKAYFGSTRSQGGCFSALREKVGANRHAVNHLMISRHQTRIDPPLLYLYGAPGKGKSFLTNRLTRKLSERFGETDSVYFRNFAQDHWDGYHGQLIAQFDDAFQTPDRSSCPDELVKETIVLKSNCLYQVPMARLEEKGRQFSSEFLIYSGNLPLDVVCGQAESVMERGALVRRFDFTVELLENDFKRNNLRAKILVFQGLGVNTRNTQEQVNQSFQGRYFEGTSEKFIDVLVNLLCERHRKSFRNCLLSKGVTDEAELSSSESWVIPVMKDKFDRPSFAYRFPSVPTVENVVETAAIPEPLKVRMITKSQPIAWALKPLQRAMWKALGSFQCFGLTQGKTIEEMLPMLEKQDGFLLSGDYSAATDRLNSDVMRTVVDELVEVFKDHHSLCHYLRWESGKHRITYPKWTGIPDVIQTRGQLMGSLLSFPILCIANAATVMTVRKQELSEVVALVNGDDLLFREKNLRVVKSWKKVATAMGLEPSVGKNYLSYEFGSINSQLIVASSRNRKLFLKKTGKFTVCGTPQLGSISMASKFEFPKPLIVKWGKGVLAKTPQSIDLSPDFGGLGSKDDMPTKKSDTRTNRQVYAFLAHRSTKVTSVPIGDDLMAVRMPHFLVRRLKGLLHADSTLLDRLRTLEQSERETLAREKDPEMEEFPWRDYLAFCQSIRKNQAWRDFCRSGCLQTTLPLRALRPSLQVVAKGDFEMIESTCKNLYWNMFRC